MLQNDNSVLVAEEFIKGKHVTKFPGGGLEFGEGLPDCLRREFREEVGLEISVVAHFYTTDFFVASAFDPDSQVISVYYVVSALRAEDARLTEAARADGMMRLRWIAIADLSPDDLSLVIDKKVATMLRENYFSRRAC